jgi:hypothetical protein
MTRTMTIGLALSLGLAAALWGCRDNQESFYIEHMKALPDPPECKYTTGDSPEYQLLVDLAFVGEDDFFAGFQVTNALMTREDYDNLKAESNGIVIEGAEAVVSAGGQTVGASVFRAVDAFLDAETTAIIEGITIPGEVKTQLGSVLGCASALDTATAVAADLAADGVLDTAPESVTYGSGYGTVRFIGHTQGCTEPTEYSYCGGTLGINVGDNLMPCTNYTWNPNATWTVEIDGGVEVGMDCDSCND